MCLHLLHENQVRFVGPGNTSSYSSLPSIQSLVQSQYYVSFSATVGFLVYLPASMYSCNCRHVRSCDFRVLVINRCTYCSFHVGDIIMTPSIRSTVGTQKVVVLARYELNRL